MVYLISTEEILLLKNQEEKNKIKQMITTKRIDITYLKIETLLNSISSAKVILNENLNNILNLPQELENKNLYNSVIQAQNRKIDKLIDLYNQANTYNKIKFIDNKIQFDKITQLNKVKLEVSNFNYDYPIRYALKTYSYDGEKDIFNIIPFGFDGIFSEYLELEKESVTTFTVNNKTNIYFYSCHYTNKGFELGVPISLEYDLDYVFDEDGKLIIDVSKVNHKEILIKYQPGLNVFNLKINKKVYAVEIIAFNDKLGIDKKINKKLVIYE